MGSPTSEHPRDGYRVVHALFRLQEGVPFPQDVIIPVAPQFGDASVRPRILLDPGDYRSIDASEPLDPPPSDGFAFMRLFREASKDPAELGGLETIRLARRAWGMSSLSVEADESRSSYPAYYAEVVARWATTIGCQHCEERGIVQTAEVAERVLRLLADAASYIMPRPFAPLSATALRRELLSAIIYFPRLMGLRSRNSSTPVT